MIITNSQLRKVINEELQIVLVEQRMELWEQRTTRELDKLLSEVDLKGAASAAIEKINDFVHTAGVKAWQFMQKGKEAAMKGIKFLSGILQKIQSFCAKRPRVCGAAKVFLSVMIMAGVVIVTAGAAQAAPEAADATAMAGRIVGTIDVPVPRVGIDPDLLEQIIGAAKMAMEPLHRNPGDAGGLQSYMAQVGDYLSILEELRSAESVHPDALSKGAQKIMSVGMEALQTYPSGREFYANIASKVTQEAAVMVDAQLQALARGDLPMGIGPK